MSGYNHLEIEKKWQERYEATRIFEAIIDPQKEKFYALVEFPYPSGAGLHVGHPRSYTALDVLARKKRMEGKNVLFPMGWDAFGLPTESFAIKNGIQPAEVTRQNVDNFRRQLKSLGYSFDWSREVNTTDPGYYKWTQWMFLKFFEAGLAYKAKVAINWCPKDKIGLANEEAVGGICDRCGGPVEKRLKEQWMIAITKYADRLLNDLETVDYLPKIKKQQEEWIGRSEGAEIDFAVEGSEEKITVFTTRPDTIFGVTYMVLAPEHKLVSELTTAAERVEVEAYVLNAARKNEAERGDDTKEKTGVFTGAFALNPVNGDKVPIWVADYVLGNYGTGAVMAVPMHDERDRAFAEKFKLPVVDRPLVSPREATNKAGGREVVKYKLRDWVFSRQRYWGEPIPLVHCEGGCAPERGGWVALPVTALPLVLPEVEKYQPTDTGESPLAAVTDWVLTTCPHCGGPARRETDTMPNWAGSSWYFLRYLDPHNDATFASKEALEYWMPVDLYNGGMEHTTLHLLYSRFWNKFLFDQGLVPTSEPYVRRHSHGLIMASDGTKMSKSKGNVVNPDEIVERFGADTFRTYILFIGPFEEPVPWSEQGVVGVRRFLEKIERYFERYQDGRFGQDSGSTKKVLEKTIRKISEDIENFKFNTAIAAFMTLTNELLQSEERLSEADLGRFLALLSPFAPHLANELWSRQGGMDLVERLPWPVAAAEYLVDETIILVVQVNGKVRENLTLPVDASEETALASARASEKVAKFLEGKTVKKIIYLPNKILNIVVAE
ncbi:MAG: class I tRNA ligase family protein [bacterium]